MAVVLLVLGIVAVVVLVQAAIWIPLTRRWKREAAEAAAAFEAEAAATGEATLLGPEKAVYRGGTGPYSGVSGSGMIVLTDHRLMFRKRTGGIVEVPVERLSCTRQSPKFLGSRVGGNTHLVVSTTDPAEVGFFVDDLDAWERAVAAVRPAEG